jgi:two-component system, OmpR family, phosphate regulon sensor histidine kinase PhoR
MNKEQACLLEGEDTQAIARGSEWSVEAVPEWELLPLLQLVHEMRSPLAAIQSCLDIVLQGYTAGNPELMDKMVSTARNRAAAMLDQVSDFLRLGAVRYAEFKGKIQPVQLMDIVYRLIPEMRVRARWRGVDLSLEMPDCLPCVLGTYEDMEHLLSNLISNAIKYTQYGGQVTVRLWAVDGEVFGTVQDTGVGIAPEDLPRIFDEFYRSRNARQMDAHGTGLGLSIAKRVAEIYGGGIEVQSQVGEGSTFTFAFPQSGDETGEMTA